MKRLLTFLFLSVLLISLTACGSDPNVTAFKEKLTASDWVLSFMGMNGITFRFNEDDTGQLASDLNTDVVANMKYTVTDATDGGESAVITITPDTENNPDVDQEKLKSIEGEFSKLNAEFVPGGLKVTNADKPDAQAIVLKPVTKN